MADQVIDASLALVDSVGVLVSLSLLALSRISSAKSSCHRSRQLLRGPRPLVACLSLDRGELSDVLTDWRFFIVKAAHHGHGSML